jgi:hypothetical protein
MILWSHVTLHRHRALTFHKASGAFLDETGRVVRVRAFLRPVIWRCADGGLKQTLEVVIVASLR